MPAPLTLLAVHAHPDDESICMGGTFARYAAEGLRTALVCCTRGEEGEIVDPDLVASGARAQLGHIREDELRAAAEVLGIADLYLLPYRDSGMEGWPSNANPQSFTRADPGAAAEHMATILRTVRPHVVVTYDEGGGYGHPDHRKAHRVTRLAIERAGRDGAGGAGWAVAKLYYTAIPLETLERANALMRARGLAPPFRPDDPARDARQGVVPEAAITARVDVRGYREQVQRALRCHRTQIGPHDLLLALPPDTAAQAFGVDHYVRAWTRIPAPGQETDLFTGLR